jgi:hypothetical protein
MGASFNVLGVYEIRKIVHFGPNFPYVRVGRGSFFFKEVNESVLPWRHVHIARKKRREYHFLYEKNDHCYH